MSTEVDTASAPAAGAETADAIWNELAAAEKPPADAGGGATQAGADTSASSDKSAAATTGTETDPAATAAGKVKDGAASSAKDTPASDDPWAAVPPDLKKKYDDLEHEVRSNRGRLAASTRKINALLAGATPAAAPAGAAAKEGAPVESNALFEDSEWKAFETEYGDVAKPIKKLIGSLAATNENLKRELATHTTQRRDDHFASQEDIALETHKDFNQAVASSEFKRWFDSAPSYVQDGVRRNGTNIVNGVEAAQLVTQFKNETGWGKAAAQPDPAAATAAAASATALSDKRRQQLESAATPRTAGHAKVSTEIPEDGDPQAIWNALAARGL